MTTGVWVKINYKHHVEFLSGDVLSTPHAVILIGALLTFICFLGCCGSLSESRCMISAFIVLAFLLFVCEVGVAALLMREHHDLNETIEEQFNYTFTHFKEHKEFSDAFYIVQSEVSEHELSSKNSCLMRMIFSFSLPLSPLSLRSPLAYVLWNLWS